MKFRSVAVLLLAIVIGALYLWSVGASDEAVRLPADSGDSGYRLGP